MNVRTVLQLANAAATAALAVALVETWREVRRVSETRPRRYRYQVGERRAYRTREEAPIPEGGWGPLLLPALARV
jgi:hypothetical protein